MNIPMLGMIGWPEMVGILLVVLILFGARKLPELARGLGQGIKEFKKATREVNDDLQRAFEEEPPPPPQRPPPPSTQTAHSLQDSATPPKA